MKKLITIALLLVGTTVIAQDQYTKGMQKAFALWGEGKTAEASNLFERIASAEPDNWLPFYYAAQVNTTASFGEKDEAKLTAQLEKAQEYTDLAKTISPDNAEIIVQQAMVHTAWVAFDGATYGMTLAGKVTALYAKAAELDPDNPRVVFFKSGMGYGLSTIFWRRYHAVLQRCRAFNRTFR